MSKRFTVQDLSKRFCTTDRTIRRWIDEGKEIIDPFTNERFIPGKDPGGNWIFVVMSISAAPEKQDELRKPAPARMRRRRILSSGVK